MVRPRDQKAPREIGDADPAGHTHAKEAQRSTKDKVCDYISALAWSLGVGGASRTIRKSCKSGRACQFGLKFVNVSGLHAKFFLDDGHFCRQLLLKQSSCSDLE